MIVLHYMSSVVPLESTALREKLLSLLKKGIAQAIVNDIELLIHESGKGSIIASKVDNILDEKTQDKLLYSYLEWAAAYIIVHEQKTLEELIEIHESSIIKYHHNIELSDHIKKMIYGLNALINEFIKQINEIKDDNVYENVIKNLEKTNSIIKYLVNKLDETEKENKELIESFTASGEKIRKIVEGILERL
jgi:gas vesicle protein